MLFLEFTPLETIQGPRYVMKKKLKSCETVTLSSDVIFSESDVLSRNVSCEKDITIFFTCSLKV